MGNIKFNFELNKEIDWLIKLSIGLGHADIKPEHFGFYNTTLLGIRSVFVEDTDTKELNPIAQVSTFGWMPKFVPESGVKWNKDKNIKDGWHSLNCRPEDIFSTVNNGFNKACAPELYGLNLIRFMFYADDVKWVDGAQEFLLNEIRFGTGLDNVSFEEAFGNKTDMTKMQGLSRVLVGTEILLNILQNGYYRNRNKRIRIKNKWGRIKWRIYKFFT